MWSDQCQTSFDNLRKELSTTPILAHPNFKERFILDTDASQYAIGAVLSQVKDGIERPIAFASRSLSKSERKYCVTRKELLAAVHFIKYFRHYLYGRQFTVRTDHSALKWLINFKDPEGQLARWMDVLSTYDFTIEHRPGRLHKNADGLSRAPCKQCKIDHTMNTCQTVYKLEGDDGLTLERSLKCLQDEDKDVKKVKDWLEQKRQPDKNRVASESVVIKSLCSQWDRLVIENGLLYRKWTDHVTSQNSIQAVVPNSERRKVLKHYHDSRTAGHLGIHKTLARIRQSYYWPGLQSDVHSYIAGCEVCTKRKAATETNKAPMHLVYSGYPMERLATDLDQTWKQKPSLQR